MDEYLPGVPAHIKEKVAQHHVVKTLRRRPRVFFDTHNFTAIDYGDIIAVDNRYFLVVAYTKEGRFGVDEQPKQWVPKVVDINTGENLILKLVFHENFTVTLGEFQVFCYRDPEKEAKILELVQGHERFMHGYGAHDQAGNLVRVLDVIQGRRLDKHIFRFEGTQEEYFFQVLPGLLAQFLDCARAIGFLHANGFRHGDIRRDHIMVEYDSGLFRWIDFDYDFYLPQRPYVLDLFELGNLLMYLTARENFYVSIVESHPLMGSKVAAGITDDDISILSKNRIVNLRKLFPYIPKKLNDIFMHFSKGTPVFYDSVDEFADDLAAYLDSI